MGLIPKWGRFPGGGNGNPLQYSCLENSMDRGAWWATVHRVTKSQTRLKRLNMHAHTVGRCSPALREPSCSFVKQFDSWISNLEMFS